MPKVKDTIKLSKWKVSELREKLGISSFEELGQLFSPPIHRKTIYYRFNHGWSREDAAELAGILKTKVSRLKG